MASMSEKEAVNPLGENKQESERAVHPRELFLGKASQRNVVVDIPFERTWRCFDWGPSSSRDVIVFLPHIGGRADMYFQQMLELCPLGYRIVSVEFGAYWKYSEWIRAFDRFLDTLNVDMVHLVGSDFGGFLAQLFASTFSRRVSSLVLIHSYADGYYFRRYMPTTWLLGWMPEFVLKRMILNKFPGGTLPVRVADSVDFMVTQVESLSRDEVGSRMTLLGSAPDLKQIRLTSKRVTILETMDDESRPEALKNDLQRRYPECRLAFLKGGGPFPYLTLPEDVNMHIRLHLKAVGVVPVPTELDTGFGVDERVADSKKLSKLRLASHTAAERNQFEMPSGDSRSEETVRSATTPTSATTATRRDAAFERSESNGRAAVVFSSESY